MAAAEDSLLHTDSSARAHHSKFQSTQSSSPSAIAEHCDLPHDHDGGENSPDNHSPSVHSTEDEESAEEVEEAAELPLQKIVKPVVGLDQKGTTMLRERFVKVHLIFLAMKDLRKICILHQYHSEERERETEK